MNLQLKYPKILHDGHTCKIVAPNKTASTSIGVVNLPLTYNVWTLRTSVNSHIHKYYKYISADLSAGATLQVHINSRQTIQLIYEKKQDNKPEYPNTISWLFQTVWIDNITEWLNGLI